MAKIKVSAAFSSRLKGEIYFQVPSLVVDRILFLVTYDKGPIFLLAVGSGSVLGPRGCLWVLAM